MSGKKKFNSTDMGKKFLPKLNRPYPPPPQKSHGQPHTSKCHPSTKWLARVHHVVVFKTKVLYFKIENKPIIDTNGKRSSKECSVSFLWTNERFLPWNCLSRNSTLFSSQWIRALGLFWTKPRQQGFWRNLRYILYTLWSRKVRF